MTTVHDHTIPEVLDHIFTGHYDRHLDVLSNAVFDRKKQLGVMKAAENLQQLKVGDRVRITGAVKPKYLKGHEATILDPEESSLEIPAGYLYIGLPRPVRKYYRLALPAQLLSLIARKENAA